ncbi:hypothetical protein BN1723_016334, partial [Verticillium longisporum]
QIIPYQNLSLDPATCVFHYAFECFEGMKAYKDKAGKIRLFRPDKNMARLNKSSARIALPTFEPTAMIELISKVVRTDERFIPSERGYSLYLRPTMIGTQKTLGVNAPGSALLYVIASPVGPYYPTGFKAITLEATDYAVRAWPGGVGDKKLGANYAPCIVPQQEAESRGHQQNLWLFGQEEFVTEVGSMNMFVALKNKETGQNELVTAPLDGTILEGVTRDSVLSLAREKLVPEGWLVSERKYTMKELDEAAQEGRLIEAFGSGTAAIISPVRSIAWKGKTVVVTAALRTPFTKGGKGGFKDTQAADLMAGALKALLERSKIDPALVEDIAVGTVLAPGGGATEMRAAALVAGFPTTTAVRTLNRQCSSGLQASIDIINQIKSGMIEIGIGAGVESMS